MACLQSLRALEIVSATMLTSTPPGTTVVTLAFTTCIVPSSAVPLPLSVSVGLHPFSCSGRLQVLAKTV